MSATNWARFKGPARRAEARRLRSGAMQRTSTRSRETLPPPRMELSPVESTPRRGARRAAQGRIRSGRERT